MMIDTHAHINKEYYPQIDDVLKKIIESGVEKIIVPGTSIQDSRENPLYKNDILYYAVGIHPSEKYPIEKKEIEKLVSKNTIAIGECGLDYFYPVHSLELQEKNFRVQIELSIEKNLPLIVHTREALTDTLKILKDYYKKGDENKGVIHSASGDIKILEKIEDLGFYLSFNGISTFKNAKNIRDLIINTDIKKILIETDSPFLTPEPKRQEKINTSANLHYILENIEKLKNEPYIKEIIYNNSKNLFKI